MGHPLLILLHNYFIGRDVDLPLLTGNLLCFYFMFCVFLKTIPLFLFPTRDAHDLTSVGNECGCTK